MSNSGMHIYIYLFFVGENIKHSPEIFCLAARCFTAVLFYGSDLITH